ncbi:MAG: glutamine synthetase, partial [Myxococcota bacterium]|nr:glutamine synthetase [Myxococcota bacterium]
MSRKEQAQKLIETFRNRNIDRVKLGGFDIDGVLRGKYVSLDKFESAVTSGFGFCDVIFGWDSADELYEGAGVTVTGWHTGYPDTHCTIDLDSLRYIPWEDNQPLFLVDFLAPDGSPLDVSPRQLAQRIVAKAEAMGFIAKTSAEFEFWVFRETPDSVREKDYRDMDSLTPGMF